MHRVGQFVAHVRARVDPSEEALVERVLPPSARMLFREMPVADRRHGLDVAHRLLASGHDAATCSPRRSFTTRAKGIGCGSGTG